MQPEPTVAAGVFVALVFAGSLAVWVKLLPKLARREPLLAYEPRRPVPWNGLFLFAVLLFFMTSTALAVRLLGLDLADEQGPRSADETARAMFAMSLASLFTVGAAVAFLVTYRRATRADLGLAGSVPQWRGDVLIGIVGFFAAVAPVFAVQFAVTQLVEYEHPLIEMLMAKATREFWAAAIFSAVIVAPIAEETLFRLLLQGWLEPFFDRRQHATKNATAVDAPPATEITDDRLISDPSDRADSATRVANVSGPVWQHASDEQRLSPHAPPLADGALRSELPGQPIRWAPILISAIAFSSMHVGQGPAPVPLFVLSLGLGYIYQRTHRIVPCIVLHALFNAYSLAVLALTLRQ